MNKSELIRADQQYIMNTYGRNPIVIDHGKGATVYDTEGNAYIDMTSGIGVSCLGYGNEDWANAVYEQSKKLAHISNLYYTEPCIRLAEKLVTRSGMDKVFFGNSGAEANEGMIKLARKYSFDRYGEGRSTIVTLVNSFHGRTITTLKATGQDHFHEFFYPFTEGFKYVPAEDLDALLNALTEDVCAVMIELIQGEGGVFPLSETYVKEVARICEERDLLLLTDEVQTGIGRTGTLFAYQGYGIQPDVVSFAKGIAGGLPMGGFLASEKVSHVMTAGTHGSTFGGNPVASAAANVVMDTLTETMLTQVQTMGDFIKSEILNLNSPYIKEVRGKGLMLGIALKELKNSDVSKAMMENGVLTLTAGDNVLRLLPPLVITEEEAIKAVSVLKKVLL